jgi:hypothetical protein
LYFHDEPEPPTFDKIRNLVREHFNEFEWTDIKMENMCIDRGDVKGGSNAIVYTPTQDFIRHYFTPENPIKGMLLWNSVGTGKTCSAIAAASDSFEKQGYTILWVTRTTLKNDIWKNMFDQVCNENIRQKMANGEQIPAEHAKRMRLLSKSWQIRPMSYKQFSNLVLKQNNFYKALVKKNGELDPLNKTLLIIDEAHKLYGGGDLSTIERPDMDALSQAIQNSYRISGKNSVRLLLMTATPITEDPMELIKLINLCKLRNRQMPDRFDEFSKEYLDETGRFTSEGEHKYYDDIAGHVSYLNREKDARQFSQPIVKFVMAPLVSNMDEVNQYDKKYVREYLDSDVGKLKEQIETNLQKLEGDLGDIDGSKFGFLKEKCNHYEGPALKACEKVVRQNIKEMVRQAKDEVKKIRDVIKSIREQITNKKLFKQESLGKIKENLEENPEKYKKFTESLYFNLKNKCGKKLKSTGDLKDAVKTNPAILSFDDRIQEFDNTIADLQNHLKNDIEAYKLKIKKIKDVMKLDLNDIEKRVVRMVLKDERKSMQQFIKTSEKENTVKMDEINKTKKIVEKQKSKKIQQIRKTLKVILNDKNRVIKETKRAEKELRKTQRKQGIFNDKIENEMLNDLVDNYSKMIDDELDGLQDMIDRAAEEKQKKQEAKQQAKELKNAKKMEEKMEKNRAKDEAKEMRKTQKLHEKEAKAAEKQLRKTEKLRDKEAKAAEKQLHKTQKLHEKETNAKNRAEKKRTMKNQPK